MENIEITKKKPAIKWSWLRILLYMIAFLFVMILTEGLLSLAVASILKVNINNLYALLQSPDYLGAHTLIKSASLATTFLVTWIFRKYIDRMSIISMGMILKVDLKILFMAS